MAVFVGYGDESGKQDDPQSTCSAYGILFGPRECWDFFDKAWNEALCRAGLHRFHLNDFGEPNGPYAHLDEAAKKQLFEDLVKAVRDAGLEAYSSAVRHLALAQFNDQTGLRLDAYALSFYTCLGYIWRQHPEEEITLYIDWVEKQHSKLACVQEYVATELTIPGLRNWFDKIKIYHASRDDGHLAKSPGYQAADFLAWETRKYVHTDPEVERRRKDVDGFIRPMDWPPKRRRRSLHELNEVGRIMGTFWDVEVLAHANEIRGGVWKP